MTEIKENIKGSDPIFRLIAENTQDLIAVLNQNHEYEYLNEEAHERILGYTKGELVETNLFNLIDPIQLKVTMDRFDKSLETGKGSMEFKIKHKNGHYIWLEIRGRTFIDEKGIKKSIIISRDITKHKVAEATLKESEKRYRSFLDHFQGIAYKRSIDWKPIFFHGAVEQITGYTESDFILGKPSWKEIIYSEDFGKIRESDEKLELVPNYSTEREYRIICKSGDIRWIYEILRNITDDSGKPIKVQGTIYDLTARKYIENKLKESEEQFKLITEQSLMGIIIVQEGLIKYVNETAANIIEYPVQETLNWTVNDFLKLVHFEDASFIAEQARIKQTGALGAITHYIYRIYTKSGKMKWLSLYSKSIPYHGKVADLITIIDITERKEAEQKLRESEEMFKLISEQSLMGIVILQDGILKYVNETVSQISEYSIEEMLSWPPYEFAKLVHPEDAPFVLKQAKIKEAGRPGAITHYYYRIISKSKKLKWISQYSKSISYQEKVADLITLIDISLRKEAERSLIESEEKYRFITENMDDIIAVLDQDFKIEYVNKAIEKVSGYSINELLGMNTMEFIHPEDLERAMKLWEEGLKTGTGHGEIRLRHKDGAIVWIEVIGKVIYDKNDQIKIILSNRDITQRKKLEEQLEESEKLYRILFKIFPDAILITDLQGNITEVSERTLELYGGDEAEELLGKNTFNFLDPIDHERALINLKKGLDEGATGPAEYSIIRKDGSLLIGELKATLLQSASGKPKAFIATIRDITERKRAEEELRNSEEKYREAYNRAEFYKDLLSHDITNILQNILFTAESGLITLDEKEKLKVKLLDIKDQIKRSAKLISSVRKLSKIEESITILQPLDVLEVIKNTKDLIYKGFDQKEIDIQIEVPKQKLYVQANEFMRDIVENILHNAVKYNRNPVAEILIRISRIEKDGNYYLKLEFLDNGIGIKDSNKKVIFERGYREDGNITGRGIGLSLVKKIINSYAGQVWVEDRVPGDYSQGSNFVVLIPEARIPIEL